MKKIPLVYIVPPLSIGIWLLIRWYLFKECREDVIVQREWSQVTYGILVIGVPLCFFESCLALRIAQWRNRTKHARSKAEQLYEKRLSHSLSECVDVFLLVSYFLVYLFFSV